MSITERRDTPTGNDSTEHEARVARILATLHGAPLCIGDARDVVVLVEDEPARVLPYAWAHVPLTALGGPDFAAAVDDLPRAPGEIVVVLVIGAEIAVRVIGLRAMQRGGQS